MTYFYRYTTSSTNGQNKPNEKDRKLWEHIATKSNWRIVQLPNGYFQAEYKEYGCEDEDCEWIDSTRRETMESAESSINTSIDHYKKRLAFFDGPKVVKTFK
jgi:pectin methylesterase-like acyl-CoA thioesterase